MSDEMAKHIDDHIKITMVWIADRGVIQCLIQPRLIYCKDRIAKVRMILLYDTTEYGDDNNNGNT